MQPMIVDPSEAGMKLLRFLEKRFAGRGIPPVPAVLHRWIRTGQVRRNGGRVKPFAPLAAGDVIRIPPCASMAAPDSPAGEGHAAPPPGKGERLSPLLRLLDVTPDFLVLEKSAGLPSQPGSGHSASVVSLLRKRFADLPFVPAPAHRLDKATSGLLLAGRSHEAQRFLHEALAPAPQRDKAAVKEYLAWCSGIWPDQGKVSLRDELIKEARAGGRERVHVLGDASAPRGAREAVCHVRLLRVRSCGPEAPASLLRVSLETGRSHQIRVQLAARGHPVIGDGKYGGTPFPVLLLHAFRVTLPPPAASGGRSFTSLPGWSEPYAIRAGEYSQRSSGDV